MFLGIRLTDMEFVSTIVALFDADGNLGIARGAGVGYAVYKLSNRGN